MAVSEQLLLSLRPRAEIRFDSFFVSPDNSELIHALRQWLLSPHPGIFFMAGPPGSGRSHLLQAASAEIENALYLPLKELKDLDPTALLENLESTALLCCDDIDAVSADRSWCEALFYLFNRHVGLSLTTPLDAPLNAEVNLAGAANNAEDLIRSGGKWLVSALAPAAQINCALPDLASRLSWGGSFRLAPLDDKGRQQMLQLQAKQRGMGISDEVAAYILRHHARDTPALLNLLERIDRESLREKQRVNVNFVRKLLGNSGVN